MNKNFKKLLAGAVLAYASISGISAESVTGQFPSLRFPDYYGSKYSAQSALMSLGAEAKDKEGSFGGCFSTTIGYQSNWTARNSKDLAQNFSANSNTSGFVVADKDGSLAPNEIISMWFPASNPAAPTTDYSPWGTVGKATGSTGSTTVTTSPKISTFFVNFSYCQDLSSYFYDGLHFYVTTAAMWMRTRVNANFSGNKINFDAGLTENTGTAFTNSTQLQTDGFINSPTAPQTITANISKLNNGLSVESFFTGTPSSQNNGSSFNGQQDLKYGKFVNASDVVSVPDIRLGMKLRVVDSENFKASLGVDGSIPTMKDVSVAEILSPRVSNNHFKLGIVGCAEACLAEGSDYKANFGINFLWHYAFEREKTKLLGHTNGFLNMYRLAYRKTDTAITASSSNIIAPLINLVQDDIENKVKCRPGQTVLIHPTVHVEKGCFVIGAGYNFHYETAEQNAPPTFKNTYILAPSIGSSTLLSKNTNGNIDTSKDGTKVEAKDFVTNAPSGSFHYLHIDLGVTCKDWQYPAGVVLNLGYEMANNRSRNREIFNVSLTGSVCF